MKPGNRERYRMVGDADPNAVFAALDEVAALRDRIVRAERRSGPAISRVHPAYEASARNLVHYLALRSFDLGGLGERLAELGLASLGRSESHVLASVHAVLRLLQRATGGAARPAAPLGRAVRYREGAAALVGKLLDPTAVAAGVADGGGA